MSKDGKSLLLSNMCNNFDANQVINFVEQFFCRSEIPPKIQFIGQDSIQFHIVGHETNQVS